MAFWHRLFKRPHKDPTSLGNLLVEHGICTEDDIAVALDDEAMLGEALVRSGKLTEKDLEVMLARQDIARGRRNGAVRSISDIALERAKESTGRWDRASTLAAVHGEKLK